MNSSKQLLTALGLGAAACVHAGPAAHGPEDAVRSYARALDEGRLDEAWALSTPLDRATFGQRYADPAARQRRAFELTQAAAGKPAAGLRLEAIGSLWRVVEPATPIVPAGDEEQARALIDHFLGAVQRGDFEGVFGDLAASWRARYTPERLKADFSSEPEARRRLERIRAALAGKWELTSAGPELSLGQGRRLKLQREGGALKVAALE